MADTKIIPISANFDMNDLVGRFTEMYQAQGFEVMTTQSANTATIKLSKDNDGIKKFAGLALEVTANISVHNDKLMINFSDAEWLGKIIGLAVGWFLCLVPFCTAVYGSVKQSEFPKKIANDIQMIMMR